MQFSNEEKSSKKKDVEDPMSNAIKMVLLNSGLNVLFKLPLSFMPVHNSIGTFYFKSGWYYSGSHLGFFKYNWILVKTGYFYLIPDLADLFYTVLISFQLFIYTRFDRKIKLAFSGLFERSVSFEDREKFCKNLK